MVFIVQKKKYLWLGWGYDDDGYEDARFIQAVLLERGIVLVEYYLDLNKNRKYDEDEKFVVIPLDAGKIELPKPSTMNV